MKRCLATWLYEFEFKKIQWNVISRQGRFWKTPKHGRYYWCRLHTKKVRKDFEKENLGEYHDLNIQSGTLCTWELYLGTYYLTDVFEILVLKYMI